MTGHTVVVVYIVSDWVVVVAGAVPAGEVEFLPGVLVEHPPGHEVTVIVLVDEEVFV